jgi:hypothetical protein
MRVCAFPRLAPKTLDHTPTQDRHVRSVAWPPREVFFGIEHNRVHKEHHDDMREVLKAMQTIREFWPQPKLRHDTCPILVARVLVSSQQTFCSRWSVEHFSFHRTRSGESNGALSILGL